MPLAERNPYPSARREPGLKRHVHQVQALDFSQHGMGGPDAVVEIGLANIHLARSLRPSDASAAAELVLEDSEPKTERHCDYLPKRKKPTEVGCCNNCWYWTWLLLGHNHGMAGTLVERGFI